MQLIQTHNSHSARTSLNNIPDNIYQSLVPCFLWKTDFFAQNIYYLPSIVIFHFTSTHYFGIFITMYYTREQLNVCGIRAVSRLTGNERHVESQLSIEWSVDLQGTKINSRIISFLCCFSPASLQRRWIIGLSNHLHIFLLDSSWSVSFWLSLRLLSSKRLVASQLCGGKLT